MSSNSSISTSYYWACSQCSRALSPKLMHIWQRSELKLSQILFVTSLTRATSIPALTHLDSTSTWYSWNENLTAFCCIHLCMWFRFWNQFFLLEKSREECRIWYFWPWKQEEIKIWEQCQSGIYLFNFHFSVGLMTKSGSMFRTDPDGPGRTRTDPDRKAVPPHNRANSPT